MRRFRFSFRGADMVSSTYHAVRTPQRSDVHNGRADKRISKLGAKLGQQAGGKESARLFRRWAAASRWSEQKKAPPKRGCPLKLLAVLINFDAVNNAHVAAAGPIHIRRLQGFCRSVFDTRCLQVNLSENPLVKIETVNHV